MDLPSQLEARGREKQEAGRTLAGTPPWTSESRATPAAPPPKYFCVWFHSFKRDFWLYLFLCAHMGIEDNVKKSVAPSHAVGPSGPTQDDELNSKHLPCLYPSSHAMGSFWRLQEKNGRWAEPRVGLQSTPCPHPHPSAPSS